MKVNLPVNMAPNRLDPSAKSSEQTETEMISPFSIQMNQILRQNGDRDDVLGDNAHPRSFDGEADAEDSGSISDSGLSGNPSDITTGREGRDTKVPDESIRDVPAGRVISKEDSAGINEGAGNERTDNSSRNITAGRELANSDALIPRKANVQTGRESDKSADNWMRNAEMPDTGLRKIGGAGALDSKDQDVKAPPVSSEGIVEDQKVPGSVQRNTSGELTSFTGKSRPSVKSPAETDGVSIRTEKDENIPSQPQSTDNGKSQERISKNGDTVRKTDGSRISVSSGREASTKTQEKNTASGGCTSDHRDNSHQMATDRTLIHNGNGSKTVSGHDADSVNAHRVGKTTGMANHASAGLMQVSASPSPAGMHPVKPVTPNSNEFLSRITERIQFLVRDGGDAVRIRLRPDEFGNLEIRAESTARGMAVRIVAEAGSVKSILENNIHMLHQNLHEMGLKVDRIQVDLQDFRDAQSHAGYSSKSGHSDPGQNGKGAHRSFGQNEHSPENANQDETDTGAFNQDGRFYTVA